MFETLLNDAGPLLQNKAFLTIDDVAQLLNCEKKVVYNWTKRADPARRPPKFAVGKSFRFPKTELLRWLAKEWKKEAHLDG